MTYGELRREHQWAEIPMLRAPSLDEHGGAINSSLTVKLLKDAKASTDPVEKDALRRLARVTAGFWKPEELHNLRQRLLEDEELWDDIPYLLEQTDTR